MEEIYIFDNLPEIEKYIENNHQKLHWLQMFHKKQLQYEKRLNEIKFEVLFQDTLDKTK